MRGPAAAQTAWTHLAQETDGHPLVNTYRGEFLLWCGAYAEAAAAFSASLERDRATKWAWIGLGATWVLLAAAGSARSRRGTRDWRSRTSRGRRSGPTRASACVGRGVPEAREALEVARETSPRRLATHSTSRSSTPSTAAPDLRLAASLEAGNRSLVGDGSPLSELEQALSCMRSNRSSSLVTWFDDQGRMRMLRWRVS